MNYLEFVLSKKSTGLHFSTYSQNSMTGDVALAGTVKLTESFLLWNSTQVSFKKKKAQQAITQHARIIKSILERRIHLTGHFRFLT